MDDIFKELNCLLCSSRDERFIFNPLGELVNGDIHVSETIWCWLERPDHVQSPACKGLGSWDGLQLLRRYMYLPSEELSSFTTSNEIFCISDGCGPIKTSSESFANQVSGGRMIATGAKVNFKK